MEIKQNGNGMVRFMLLVQSWTFKRALYGQIYSSLDSISEGNQQPRSGNLSIHWTNIFLQMHVISSVAESIL